ncbi:MAG: hypothetical protein WCT32_02940 [Patescibacteria group bacterium]|jgi:hypothetical protein
MGTTRELGDLVQGFVKSIRAEARHHGISFVIQHRKEVFGYSVRMVILLGDPFVARALFEKSLETLLAGWPFALEVAVVPRCLALNFR